MLSVVEDFNKLKKYNIESILGINNAGIPEQPKKVKDAEKEETAVEKEVEEEKKEEKTDQEEWSE